MPTVLAATLAATAAIALVTAMATAMAGSGFDTAGMEMEMGIAEVQAQATAPTAAAAGTPGTGTGTGTGMVRRIRTDATIEIVMLAGVDHGRIRLPRRLPLVQLPALSAWAWVLVVVSVLAFLCRPFQQQAAERLGRVLSPLQAPVLAECCCPLQVHQLHQLLAQSM